MVAPEMATPEIAAPETVAPQMTASEMVTSDPSYFGDFEQVKNLIVIFQTLDK